jgi:hypothetical protein
MDEPQRTFVTLAEVEKALGSSTLPLREGRNVRAKREQFGEG